MCLILFYLLCAGTPADIDNALAMIRQRFPPRKYPNVTIEQVTLAPATTTFPLVPDFCQVCSKIILG